MAAKKSSLLAILKPLLAIAVLAVVFSMLPWTDVLKYQSSGPVKVAGEIEGDWKADAIVFRVTNAAEESVAVYEVARGGCNLRGCQNLRTVDLSGAYSTYQRARSSAWRVPRVRVVALEEGFRFVGWHWASSELSRNA